MRPPGCYRNAIDFFSNLRSDHFRLRMIKDKSRSSWRFSRRRLIPFSQKLTKSIRVKSGARHKTNCHKARFKFLVAAVPQERRIDAEGNAKFAQLFFPRFSRG